MKEFLLGSCLESINDLDINISDDKGNLRNIDEIIGLLKNVYENYNIKAMDWAREQSLNAEKRMLGRIINYLERIIT